MSISQRWLFWTDNESIDYLFRIQTLFFVYLWTATDVPLLQASRRTNEGFRLHRSRWIWTTMYENASGEPIQPSDKRDPFKAVTALNSHWAHDANATSHQHKCKVMTRIRWCHAVVCPLGFHQSRKIFVFIWLLTGCKQFDEQTCPKVKFCLWQDAKPHSIYIKRRANTQPNTCWTCVARKLWKSVLGDDSVTNLHGSLSTCKNLKHDHRRRWSVSMG